MHIDSYQFGTIVVDGRTYTQDLILLPDGIQEVWWRQEGHLLQVADVTSVITARPEVLIVGKGQPGKMQVDAALAHYLREIGIELIEGPTNQACTTFNAMAGKRKVAAALHLTC